MSINLPLMRSFKALCSAVVVATPLVTHSFAADSVVVEKSPNDPREYRSLVLDNGLKVLLVHDATTDKAAASLDVAIGSGSDPEDRAGLAHFLEHMLFLGTKKYPDPGEYSAFIREHGGSNNAYTAFANTNYFFDVEAAHLEPALDRFAQFFVAPLFTADLVEREKNAVHSEYSGKKRTDGRRIWSARRVSLNPEHPMGRFSTGSLETLADREGSTIRDELLKFYDKFYSANIMSLSVLGSDSLDTLEKYVRERFSAVPNQKAMRQEFDIPLYKPEDLPVRLEVKPLKEQRFISLSFPVPQRDELRDTRPAGFVGNILGHEGKGSLLSSLKAKGWVESLSAGGGMRNRKTATFDVSIGITEAGLKHVDDIVAEVFQAIRLVKEQGVKRWLHDEGELLSELSFRFQEKSEPSSLVRSLASRLHDWPADRILSGPYRTPVFSTDDINELLDRLRPDNLAMILVAPEVETDSKTKWYDAQYRLSPLPKATIERWQSVALNDAIKLPEPNAFIPRNLDLVESGSALPERIEDVPGFELWHQSDTSFGVPRANFYMSVRSPVANASPRNLILTEMFTRVVNESLNEFSYPAALAGVSYSLYRHSRGFSMRLGGYADGQRNMLKQLVAAIRKPRIDPEVFDRLRDEVIREIRDVVKEPPYEQTIGEVRRYMTVPYFEPDARIAAAEKLTPEDLAAFVPELLSTIDVVTLSHGNITEEESRARAKIVRDTVVADAKPVSVERSKLVALAPDAEYVQQMDITHNDSSIAVYIQGNDRSRAERARFAVLSSMMSQPFYEELRTRQQLGYYVFATTMTMMRVPALLLSLQSPGADPRKMNRQIDRFMADFEKELDAMSDEDFERHRQAVLSRVEEADKRLSERSGRYWTELDLEEFNFDTREKFADSLRAITKDQVTDTFRELLVKRDAGRLVVYNTGAVATDADGASDIAGKPAGDRTAFKTGKTLYAPEKATN